MPGRLPQGSVCVYYSGWLLFFLASARVGTNAAALVGDPAQVALIQVQTLAHILAGLPARNIQTAMDEPLTTSNRSLDAYDRAERIGDSCAMELSTVVQGQHNTGDSRIPIVQRRVLRRRGSRATWAPDSSLVLQFVLVGEVCQDPVFDSWFWVGLMPPLPRPVACLSGRVAVLVALLCLLSNFGSSHFGV